MDNCFETSHFPFIKITNKKIRKEFSILIKLTLSIVTENIRKPASLFF